MIIIKKINSINELNSLINIYFNKKHFMNFLQNPSSLEKYILEQNLYYISDKDNLIILVDRDTHYLGYYYLIKEDNNFNFSIDKNIVFEYSYNTLRYDSSIEDILNKMNFKELNNRTSLSLDLNNIDRNFDFEKIDNSFLDEIYNCILENFNPYYGCIKRKDELLKSIENNEIFPHIDYNELVGFIEFSKKRNIFTIDHFCVFNKYKNMGYGSKILSSFIEYSSCENIKKIDLFVLDNNISAINVYKKMNFKETKIKSKIFMKEV